MLADGHIHTPFCPHGSSDSFEEYIEWFIKNNVEEISFTEHAPLPNDFDDTTPTKDSAMTTTQLTEYIEQLKKLQQKYKKQIKINIGLEVDYIEGYDTSITSFLQDVGPLLDDSILSVHFIKDNDNYYCIDYSDDYFNKMIQIFGSVSNIYEKYYDTVKQSIKADLGPFKPKRIGHITLAHKFQLKYPPERNFKHQEEALLSLVRHHQLALDYNGAGIAKKYCAEPYPPEYLVKRAMELGIPLVYGSDAHCAKDLGQGFKYLYNNANLVKPSSL
ncbi:histidinol-phosphatase HisJ [Bacillus massiliigorillae]|uniref:histidinol-phosphatase HisJ n=1 Tax=Bacillus massiliigorillae TaxID=1243664 RepID=UPI0003A3A1D5|nr:histidinol-phosphatase HisJ [Bacillus massiliigorillae]